MSGERPEEMVRLPALVQRWRWVAFLHWPFDPAEIEPLLPGGVVPDVVDGRAWVALTPMVIDRVSPLGLPLPERARPCFPETNLRTYVRTPGGIEGIWFLDLEAQHLPTTVGGRLLYGVPYHRAAMDVERDGDHIRYRSQRRSHRGEVVGHDIAIRVGAPVEDEATTAHLVGRWRAIGRRGRVTTVARVQHPPWPLHRATVTALDETLLASVGLERPGPAPLVHWSPGVDVALSLPRPRFGPA